LTTATDAAGLPVRRLASTQQVPAAKPRRAIETVAAAATLPAWALTPPRNETAPTIPLVPSKLAPLDTDAIGDPIEAAPPPRDEPPGLPPTADLDTRRFLRGTLTHALLEHLPSLPAERWATAAAAFVEQRGAPLSPRQQRSIVSETLAILQSAKFAPLFGPQSQAEVPIVAVLDPPAGRRSLPLRLTGIIDRLAVTDAGVLILDYKTNRPPPTERTDVPMAYRLQLAAYRLAIRGLYPGLPVTAAILWTDGARLMEIPDTDLDAVESALWG
jgi:ATP-dependent helicase/nuclease subunit A